MGAKSFEVDVALATFNGDNYLQEMLRSYSAQSLLPARIVISDDGSTDGTLEIISNFKGIEVACSQNHLKGIVSNFENAISNCHSNYIAISDQDDSWHPEKLQKLMAAMRDMEETFGKQTPILVFSDLRIVDERLKTINESFYKISIKSADVNSVSDFVLDCHIPGCSMIINRPLACKALPFGEATAHDWWLCLVASAFGKIRFVDQALISYRQHGSNAVGLGAIGRSPSRKFIALLNLWHFVNTRIRKMRKQSLSIQHNLLQFKQRFGDSLAKADSKLISDLVDGSSFFKKIRVLNRKRVGLRLFDFLILMWFLRKPFS